MKENRKEKNNQITGFRSILCIFIVLYHFVFRFFEIYKLSGIQFNQWVPNAMVWVSLFFILSGYYLKISSLKEFWISKIKNIYIPYCIAVIVIFAVESMINGKIIVSTIDLFANLLCFPLLTGKFNYVDGAHWYIVYLLYFYVIYSIIFIFSKKIKKLKILDLLLLLFSVGIIVTYFLPNNGGIVYLIFNVLFNNRLIYLVFGVFLKKFFDSKKYVFFILPIFVFLLVILGQYFWINYIYFVVFLSILLLCLLKKVRFLENKPFIYFGNTSLWIYLLHQDIGYCIIKKFYDDDMYWFGVLIAILVIVFCSGLFKKYYEILVNKLFRNKEVTNYLG